MFDWLEFDEKKKAEFERQAEYLGDRIREYLRTNSNVRELPVNYDFTKEDIEFIESIDIPAKGRDAIEVGDELVKNVLLKAPQIQHPKFFSFVASAVSPYSIAGSVLTDIYNPNMGAYMLTPGASIIENKLVKWMGSLAGYSEEKSGGTFVSGGSMASMSAMMIARETKLAQDEYSKGVAYISDQTHMSSYKGLRLIGFREDQIVKIPSDDEFKMRTDLLEETIKADIERGMIPFAVVGTLGTTNTGTIDPFEEIGKIAKKYNLWFHIDGAYGGSSLVSPIYRKLSKGMELSDSFAWDTHKWLMQVYSCSAVIVKNRDDLISTFAEEPEYLADLLSEEYSNGWDISPEMSRPARAIRLWYTLQATGTDLLAELIEYTIHNAKVVEMEISKKANWVVESKPSLGTINIRYVKEGMTAEELDSLNAEISKEILDSGFAHVVTTVIKGKKVLRMCMINANSTEKDIIETVERLDEIAIRLTEGK